MHRMSKQTFAQFWLDTFNPCSLRSRASSVPGQGSHTTPLASCVGCKDKSCWHRTLCCLFTMASCSTLLPSPSHCSSSKNSHVSLPLLITVLDRLQSCLFSHYDMISPAKPLLTDIISHSFLLCKSGSTWEKKGQWLGKKSLSACNLIDRCPIMFVTLITVDKGRGTGDLLSTESMTGKNIYLKKAYIYWI